MPITEPITSNETSSKVFARRHAPYLTVRGEGEDTAEHRNLFKHLLSSLSHQSIDLVAYLANSI